MRTFIILMSLLSFSYAMNDGGTSSVEELPENYNFPILAVLENALQQAKENYKKVPIVTILFSEEMGQLSEQEIRVAFGAAIKQLDTMSFQRFIDLLNEKVEKYLSNYKNIQFNEYSIKSLQAIDYEINVIIKTIGSVFLGGYEANQLKSTKEGIDDLLTRVNLAIKKQEQQPKRRPSFSTLESNRPNTSEIAKEIIKFCKNNFDIGEPAARIKEAIRGYAGISQFQLDDVMKWQIAIATAENEELRQIYQSILQDGKDSEDRRRKMVKKNISRSGSG